MKTRKYKSAKIQIVVDDVSIGKNQLDRVGEFVGSFIPGKITQLMNEAKAEFPNGKIRYHLIVIEYVQSKKIKSLLVPKYKRVTLSEIDTEFC